MKKGKSIAALFAMTVALLLAFQSSLTASAAGNTYIIHYNAEEEEWYYQAGSTWNDDIESRELYYLQQDIKDGDLLVVEGNGGVIKVNVRLSNLSLLHGASAIVTANSIDECYLFGGSVCAINGNVTNAYVYEDAAVTFNNSVGTLQIIGEYDVNASATVAGTVSRVIAKDNDGVYYEYSNFTQGKLKIENGEMKTEEQYYSTSPSAAAPPTQTSQPQKASATSASEYDDVPKTGEGATVYWLLGIAVACLAGRYALRKIS